MSGIPKPDPSAPVRAWKRPEPLPADYRDDLTDEQFKALQKISKKEVTEDFEVVDGPAW